MQTVFGIGHRLLADLISDDVAAADSSFEESRLTREDAMEAHSEMYIRDRIESVVRAHPRTQRVLRADDVIIVWKTNPPSKRGLWFVRSVHCASCAFLFRTRPQQR